MILFNLNIQTNYNITKESNWRILLKVAKIFIWDETPMTNKAIFKGMDRLLRDIIGDHQPIGEKLFMLNKTFDKFWLFFVMEVEHK